MRDPDYAAAKKETGRYPVQVVDLLSAWRHRWETSTESQRVESLRQTARQRVGRGRRRAKVLA